MTKDASPTAASKGASKKNLAGPASSSFMSGSSFISGSDHTADDETKEPDSPNKEPKPAVRSLGTAAFFRQCLLHDRPLPLSLSAQSLRQAGTRKSLGANQTNNSLATFQAYNNSLSNRTGMLANTWARSALQAIAEGDERALKRIFSSQPVRLFGVSARDCARTYHGKTTRAHVSDFRSVCDLRMQTSMSACSSTLGSILDHRALATITKTGVSKSSG